MKIQHDKALDIAWGNSRKTKTWKNKPAQWSALLDRLSKTTRTPETVAEYKAMGKAQRDEIKNTGGFVGGYCNNGSRSDIRHRSLLCLDADYADRELWEDWGLLYGNAAAVYSTHSHTPEKPRLRLIVPLSRNVDPEEYIAIGRKVAENLGIDKFDDTTYQPQRLMYWPSTSQDGEYFFRYTDAPFLDPDKILATYYDWHDTSAWPISSREAARPKKEAGKQKDPLEKGGLVGAFCRAYYPITEAIEAFIPTYQPCDDPNRYTYTEGSCAAGVVIFEDGKFSYSFHATDPASCQTVNAWDLVRLHHFRELDKDSDPDTPAASLPSYKAMAQLATEDKRVVAQIVNDRTEEALADFDAPPEEGQEDKWQERLKLTEKGGLAQSIENIVLILRHDPKLAGGIALDEMRLAVAVKKRLPWRKPNDRSPWADSDDAALRYYLERVYGIASKDKIFDAVNIVATENAFHPVKEYLEGCAWDGEPRVESLFIDYMGAADTDYTRTVTRKMMAAAVARIYSPGCKFDYVVTLRGAQGLGKSSLAAKLGGPWFSDSFTAIQGKDSYEQLLGVWIMEIGELAGLKKAEVEAIKLYISKQVDRFRPAYGRRTQEFPRQCIFIGSTNETQFLRDATGNRRFWVVDTPNTPARNLWEELTPETVKKIWAEAVEIYRKGEKLYLSKEMEAVAREIQEAYAEENPNAGIVAEYLDRLLPAGWEEMDLYARRNWLEGSAEGTEPRRIVCSYEIWAEALGRNPDKFDGYAAKEMQTIMATIPGWRRAGNKRVTIRPYGRQRYYERKATK